MWWWVLLRALAIVAGCHAGCAAATRQHPQPAKARAAGIVLRPAIALIGCMSSGVKVTAFARIHNPTAEARCAAEVWVWGDGDVSGWEDGSCVEDELEPWTSPAPMVVIGEHIYRQPGVYTVQLILAKGRRIVARDTATLQVRGGCGE